MGQSARHERLPSEHLEKSQTYLQGEGGKLLPHSGVLGRCVLRRRSHVRHQRVVLGEAVYRDLHLPRRHALETRRATAHSTILLSSRSPSPICLHEIARGEDSPAFENHRSSRLLSLETIPCWWLRSPVRLMCEAKLLKR